MQWMLMRISETMKEGELVPNVHCHIDKGLMEMTSAFYTCDRIFTTPIPLMYTRHTARFLLIWLLTVPMSLYHEFRKTQTLAVPFIIPLISFFNAIFLFGIEELGVQIEEPFSILPLANICNDIQYAGEDLLSEGGVSWFDKEEKLVEKNAAEKEKMFEVEKERVKLATPSAKDVFVYPKKGEKERGEKGEKGGEKGEKGEVTTGYDTSALLKSSVSTSVHSVTMDLPSVSVSVSNVEREREQAISRKDLSGPVSRNFSVTAKRDLLYSSTEGKFTEGKYSEGKFSEEKGKFTQEKFSEEKFSGGNYAEEKVKYAETKFTEKGRRSPSAIMREFEDKDVGINRRGRNNLNSNLNSNLNNNMNNNQQNSLENSLENGNGNGNGSKLMGVLTGSQKMDPGPVAVADSVLSPVQSQVVPLI